MIKFLPMIFFVFLNLSFGSYANSELEDLDNQVRAATDELESKYGISVSYSEQQLIKVNIIAKKISDSPSSESTETKILKAVSTYQISEQYLQRQLVIQVGTNGAGHGSGQEPF